MKTDTMIMIVLSLTGLTLLGGCQAATDNQAEADDATVIVNQQEEIIDRGVPFTNGPSEPPQTIVGPTAPPPDNDSLPLLEAADVSLPAGSNSPASAKAVTTNENIRITLPVKTD